MTVLLVSDPTAGKASATMSVRVGAMADPDNLPGLAHFCEHMLFMGSKKYPGEKAYHEFINAHGGTSNAHTTGEETDFYFDVSPDALEGALDIFAQFFISPLFTEGATTREINAVNSEHEKNINQDMWRLNHLEKSLGTRLYPYYKFFTGNSKTLAEAPKAAGVDVRAALFDFHSRYYSASVMKLCVLGRESLDALEDMARRLFSAVPNSGRGPPNHLPSGHRLASVPYDAAAPPMRLHVLPLRDSRYFKLAFPVFASRRFYRSNPARYYGNLVGHEGPGSVLSLLKAKGWATTLMAGCGQHVTDDFDLFEVTVELTEEGLDHVEDAAEIVFQYLNMLRRDGPQRQFFGELQGLGELEFRFAGRKPPMQATLSTASAMQIHDIQDVLSANHLYHEFNPQVLTSYLQHLVPSRCRLVVVTTAFANKLDKKEDIYGTEYSFEPLDPAVLRRLEACGYNKDLSLPQPNEFIPRNVDIKPPPATNRYAPSLVRNDAGMRVWHKQDQDFKKPDVNCLLQLRSPEVSRSPRSTVCSLLLTSLVSEALNEYAYASELAGLRYALAAQKQGLVLQVCGYGEKVPVLLERIVQKLASVEIDKDLLAREKDKLRRRYVSDKLKQPYQHSMDELNKVLLTPNWTTEQKLNEVESVTVEEVEHMRTSLLAAAHVDALVHGNTTADEAVALIAIVQKELGFKALPETALQPVEVVQLTDGDDLVRAIAGPNPEENNSALFAYFQIGQATIHTSNLAFMVAQILRDSAFDVLRSQEQLGYIVDLAAHRAEKVRGVRVVVQSDKYAPPHLDDRLEAFLKVGQDKLDNLTEEEFAQYVAALKASKSEPDTQLAAETSRFWGEISNEHFMFDRVEVEVADLESNVTLEEVRAFFRDHVAPGGPRRRKISVQVFGAGHALGEGGGGSIDDHEAFVKGRPKFPAALDEDSAALARFSKAT